MHNECAYNMAAGTVAVHRNAAAQTVTIRFDDGDSVTITISDKVASDLMGLLQNAYSPAATSRGHKLKDLATMPPVESFDKFLQKTTPPPGSPRKGTRK
jgi:hypothetical protein